MGEWKSFLLEQITEPIKDGFLPSEEDIRPYIGLEHIEQETLRLNSVGFSSDVTSNKFCFLQNDVLFGKLRPYFRKVVKPKFSGICSTDIWVFRAKEGFSQEWLFYFLSDWSFVNTADGGDGGTRMPRADWNFLKITEWNVPSKEEQQEIAEILSSLDDKIDLLHRQNKTIESLAETLFRQWFIEETSTISVRQIFLGDLINTISDTHPLLSPDIIFLNTSDIYLGRVLKDDRESVHSLPGQAKKSIRNGDILFSEIRPANGRYAYVDFDAEDYVVSTKLMVLRSKGILSQAFVYFFLTNSKTVEWLQTLAEARSGTFPQITFDQLRDLIINIPSEEGLVSASLLCDDWLKKIKFNQSQMEILENIRDVILPKLMSGEIRVRFNSSKDSEAA